MAVLNAANELDKKQLIWLMALESQRYHVLLNRQLATEIAIPLSGHYEELKTHLGEDFRRAAESESFRKDLEGKGYAQQHFTVSANGKNYLFLITAELVTGDLLIQQFGEHHGSQVYIGVLTDLSELVQKDNAIEKQMAEYMDALELKDKFLSQISHELRTPLNGIAGMAQLLVMTELDDEQSEYIRILKTASTRMNRLISNLIHYTHLFSGMPHKSGMQQIILRDFFRQLIETQKSDLADKEISVEVSISPSVDSRISVDAASLEIALDQIIDNAVKFSREGQIYVSASVDESDDQLLVIEVQDEGLGFDVALNQFSKRFEKGPENNGNQGGLGVGLLIVKRLESLGVLHSEIESKRGFGTKVTLKIPHLREQMDTSHRYDRQNLFTGKKALVVDDDENGRVILSIMSKKLGMTCDVAENGMEALKYGRDNSYDIIYLDIQMPGINGIEVLKQMRDMNSHRHTPMVAVTAYALKGDEEKFLASGFDGYIAKPVEASRFETTTSRMLQLKY